MTERFDLNIEAPDVAECEVCRDRFVGRLRDVAGIRSVRREGASLDVEVDGSNEAWRRQAETIAADVSDGVAHAHIPIGGLDCPACAESVRDGVASLPGVLHADASFIARRLSVEYDPARLTPERIADKVRSLGFTAETATPRRTLRSRFRLAATGALFAVGVALALAGLALAWLPLLAVILVEARPIYLGAVASVRRRALDMQVLMAVAILGAVLLGEWVEAAAVAWLAAVGVGIQEWAGRRTRTALDALLSLAPPTARLMDGGETRIVDVSTVRAGSLVQVFAGDRIPLDGEVVEGCSEANQSAITGESLPSPKSPGASVFAGTVNLSGTLVVRVTREASNSTLARMVRLVEEARERRAPVQSTIDRFAAYYTPGVITLAALLAAGPPLVAGLAWQPWIERGLWLLIVACPCALVISTPVAVVSAIGAATRMGALIKGGSALETLARVRTVAFDKTGTLTRAELAVSRVEPAGMAENELLTLAAAAGRQSRHPASVAIVREAAGRVITIPGARDVRTVAGQGVEAAVGGSVVRVGRAEWLGVEASPEAGEIAVAVSRDGAPRGVIYLRDMLREEARRAVEELRRLGVERHLLLSGDAPAATEAFAAELDIADHRGGLMPEDKERIVRGLVEEAGPVLMVGDGVNDLAAMQAASAGMAMGAAGTDAAIEQSDVVLMNDDLEGIPRVIALSRGALRVMRENIALSLAVKLGLVLLAVAYPLPLWLAVMGDVGLSVLVTLNAARLHFAVRPAATPRVS